MEKIYDKDPATCGIGDRLEWKDAPGVVPPIGMLPFAAPSNRGMLEGIHGAYAVVRFQYTKPTGGIGWSDPLQVTPGSLCRVV